MDQTLHWATLGAAGACHIGRIPYSPAQRFGLHDHDFAELCWVERGRLRHETAGGWQDLEPGDALFVRPEQRHGLRGLPGGGVLLNLAFPSADLAELERRYGGADWPWAPGPDPARRRLPGALLSRATARAAALPPTAATRLARDALLLAILDGLERSAERRWRGLPPWLAEALDALAEDDDGLAAGVEALARRCGRSREHLARTVRQALARSPTDLLCDLRCERAARRLAHGAESAQAIATSLGFANRTWFHRVFRARYACTPAEYRRQARAAAR
jgi:AraC family cel operon transcriptional repressor